MHTAMDIESVAFLPETNHQHQSAWSDLGPVGQYQQQQQQQQNQLYQQSSLTEQHHPLQANLFLNNDSGGHISHQSTISRSQNSNPSGVMPTIAAANQLLSDLNSPTSTSTPFQNNHNLLAAAELPITSSGVRIASPTSRPSKHPPPSVPSSFATVHHQSQSQHPNNHQEQSQSQSQSTVLLPTRVPPLPSRRSTSTRVSGATSSLWRTLFSSCIAVETERTIACTDRVIYRPTADDEEQQVVTAASSSNHFRRNRRIRRRRRSSSSSSNSSSNQTIMACCSGRRGACGGGCRQCLQRLALIILLLLIAAVLLEVVHLLTNTCHDSPGGQSWLSHLFPSLGAVFSSLGSSLSSSSSASPSGNSFTSTPSSIDILFNDTTETIESPLPYLDTEGAHYPWQAIRLPVYLKPKSYELFLSPSMVFTSRNYNNHSSIHSSAASSSSSETHPTFINRGNVSIEFEITTHSAAFIVLHSKKLNISKVAVTRLGGHLNLSTNVNFREVKPIPVTRVVECTRLEQLYIELGENITSGNVYLISLEFARTLEDELEGFYVSSYTHSGRKGKQYLLTTHFEPTLARTAFPCFDEPAMKATFRLKLLHQSNYTVFFNTEIVETRTVRLENGETKTLSISETTVPMSTYLVAFVVCDFAVSSVKNDDSSGIVVRTVVPEEQNVHTAYALQFGSKVISFFQKFFKVEYPLRKLDMVAVPDFSAGAMENWGIITFRTTTLLYNERESSSEMQEQVATVISHEIAHQWFGNLVTMNWWSELWLNEGFASYVENLGVDNIHPEWRMLDQFVISTTQLALSIDSLFTSHPIHTTVANPSEIEAIFDMISYKKGACLIRMIEDFLGKENLQLGLEKYLNRYKYSTATTKQLWESMSEVSSTLPINVSTIMDTWILQQGYPVISARWSDDGRHILVSQRRFVSSVSPEEFERQLLIGNNGSNPLFNNSKNNSLFQKWIVPLTIISGESPKTSTLFWLQADSLAIPLGRSQKTSGKSGWFKLNHQQSGFYRVNYETAIWRDLIQQLVNSPPDGHFLSAADRAGLLDDALSLMRIGHLDVNTALDLTRYLETGEQDYVPWETVLNHLGILDTLMLQHPALHRYALRLMARLVEKLGWSERRTDSLFEKKLRSIVLRSAVYFGDQASIGRARAEFNSWLATGRKPAANIRDIVYHAGTQWGGDREWQAVWDAYLSAGDASEKRLLLGALGSTRNHYLLSSYLSAALNKSLVRTQDTPYAIQNVARNPNGRLMAWQFIKASWPNILATFGGGSFSLDAIISETTWHFSTEYEYTDVKEFFGRVSVGSGRQAVRQSMEKIRANIYWKGQVEGRVIRWLNATTAASAAGG